MEAKKYIYRNLHTDTFSIKYQGKVVGHFKNGYMLASFKVNQAGRERVVREGKKYVHAYIVADAHTLIIEPCDTFVLREVTYNPYRNNEFIFKDTGETVQGTHKVYVKYPKVYVIE